MLFSTELILAACIGAAMAGPTHLHRHRDVHAKKDLADVDWKDLDWDNMGINWSSAWAAGQTTSTSSPIASPTATATATASPIIAVAKPAVTSSSTVVKVASSTSSSSAAASSTASSSIISELKTAFSGIVGMANKVTSFGTATSTSGSEVSFVGNIGSPEGSNMMLVDSIEGYDFTNTFENTQSVAITVVVWNKAASSSSGVEANLGSCLALTNPALSFTLAPGGTQSVAFQDETQCGWAQATSATTASGAPDTTWGEANFVSTGSGYDVSSIVNSLGNTYFMSISSAESTCVSDPTQNDWIAKDGNSEDPIPIGDSDGSCYIPGSTMTLHTKLGGNF